MIKNNNIPEILYNDIDNLIEIFTVDNTEIADMLLTQLSSSIVDNKDNAKLFKLKHARDLNDTQSVVFVSPKSEWYSELDFLFKIYSDKEVYEKCAIIHDLKKSLK